MRTEKRRSFIINFTYWVLLVVIALLLTRYALPMLAPFVIGSVIAYMLRRPTQYAARRLKLPYKPMALLAVLLFYATVGLLTVVLVLKAFSGAQMLVSVIPELYEEDIAPLLFRAFAGVENALLQIDPSLFGFVSSMEEQLMQSLGNMISSLSAWAVGTISGLATGIPALFIDLVLMIISSFFMATDFDLLTGFCARQMGEKGTALFNQIRQYVIGTLFVCIRSYAIIMFLTFLQLAVGLALIGVNHPVLIAALTAAFDILPVLGTGGVMLPWAAIVLLSGDYSLAIGLTLVYVVITVVRNIIEPKIVGAQLGLHPMVTLVSMYAGLQLFGVVGLFGAPILLSLLRHLNANGTVSLYVE